MNEIARLPRRFVFQHSYSHVELCYVTSVHPQMTLSIADNWLLSCVDCNS